MNAQNVGVGTTTPQSRLHIVAPSGYTLPLLQVEMDGSAGPYLIVQPDGKVGVGIANPSEALDVSGNVQFSGALMPGGNAGTSGFVLMSQGAGNPPVWMDTALLKDDWGSQVAVTQSPIVGDGTSANPIGLQGGTNTGDILIWDGAQWVIKPSPFDSVCGTAMVNYVQKWTGSELCNSIIYDDGTRIGIGTTLPTERLDVTGKIYASDGLKPNYESSWVFVASDNDTTLYFNTGFLPTRVTVLIQYRTSGWTDTFSILPPCFTTWDDLFTLNLSCYYLSSTGIFVYHNGFIYGSPGSYIINGSLGQRIKVLAWK